MSEQSAGFLVLLFGACIVGNLAWNTVRAYEWPAYSPPACQFSGKYIGRDQEERPQYEYGERCYE